MKTLQETSRRDLHKDKETYLNALRFSYIKKLTPRQLESLIRRNANGEDLAEMIDNLILSETKGRK